MVPDSFSPGAKLIIEHMCHKIKDNRSQRVCRSRHHCKVLSPYIVEWERDENTSVSTDRKAQNSLLSSIHSNPKSLNIIKKKLAIIMR